MSVRLLFSLISLMSISAQAQWITGYFVDTSLNMGDIPWSKMTHVVHFKAYPADGSGTLTGISGANADQFTNAAHAAGVKALLCVADNSSNHAAFSGSAGSNLSTFANNIVNFVLAHNYDGVDFDWEAGSYRSDPDRSSYINLITAVKRALPGKVVTSAVYWNNGLEGVMQGAAASLDQVNVMCYDMDQWLSHNFYNDALYLPAGDTTHNGCAAEAAQFATAVGAAKIGIGIPFYGRVWSGCSNSSCSEGLYSPLQTWSGTANQSTIFYKDLVNSSYWSYPKSWDAAMGASYISVNQSGASGDRFISFTGDQQIAEAVKMGKSRGYGGYMTFEVEYDFLSSASGDARHPLATSVYGAVFGSGTPTQPPANAAPVISGGLPTGTVSGAQATLSVTTNENATCKYGTVANAAYSSIASVFQSTGGTTHTSTLASLAAGQTYNYYVRCADSAGLATTSDYTITFSTAAVAPPVTTGSVTPNSGSGSSAIFKVVAASASGYAALQQVDLSIGSAVGAAKSCWVEYGPAARTLYLKSDDNATWSQAALGSGATLANSQCSINTATSTATGSGTTLTLSLPVTFTSAFTGTQNLTLFYADSGSSSGWLPSGTWTVPAPPPPTTATVGIQVTPTSGSGQAQTFAAVATDSLGASRLQQVDIFIGGTLGAASSCWIEYSPSARLLYLKSNDNATWSQTALGSGTLRNSQCTVNAAAATATVSGTTLSLNVPVTFASSYAGAKSVIAFAAENGGSSGWKTTGSWTVTVPVATAPAVTVNPSAAAGMGGTFAVQATDSKGYAALQQVDVFFGSQVGASGSCWVEVWPSTRALFLKADNGQWMQSSVGGAALSNSVCSVIAGSATLSGSGNTLTFGLPVSFKSAAKGAKSIFTFAADSSANSGWKSSGTYTVQ